MIYVYRCRECQTVIELPTRADSVNCPNCFTRAGRDYSSVQFSPDSVKPHFNHAVGQYVTSSRDFDEKLHVAGQEAGTVYSRVDPGDMPSPGGDSESMAILETQAKTLRDRGFTDSRGKVSIDDAGSFIPQ